MRVIDYLAPGASWLDVGLAGLKLAIVAVLLIGGAVWLVNKITSFDDFQVMFHERNIAYTIQRAGLLLGTGWSLTTLIDYKTKNPAYDFVWLVVGGMAVIGVMLIWRLLLHKLVPFREDQHHRTISVGVVRGAYYWAAGLVIGGAISNGSETQPTAALGAVVFTIFGLGLLVGFGLLNGQRFRPSLASKVQDGNLAAAIIQGSMILSLGFVLQGAISGRPLTATTWPGTVIAYAVMIVVSVMVNYLLVWFIDKVAVKELTLQKVVRQKATLPAAFIAAAVVTAGYMIGHLAV